MAGFLQAVKGANFTFDSIVFDRIKFDEKAASALVNALQTFPVFSALLSLCFVECASEAPPFQELVVRCLQGRESLTTFQAENCGVDIVGVLVAAGRVSESKLQNVNLRRNRAQRMVEHEEMVLWPSLLWLNLGASEWFAGAFQSFLTQLCRQKRRTPIALWIDSTHMDALWSDVFDNLPLESLEPVITELNFSRNELDLKSYERFNSFLETQSPLLAGTAQYPNKLAHLNISHSFSFDISNCVDRLFAFFEARDVWGLEICGIQPSAELANIRGLHSLNIGDNQFDANSAHILKTFVRESPTIAELGIDNVEFKDVSAMMTFYLDILTNPRILAFARPNMLLQKYPTFNETKKIRELLQQKRSFPTTAERLQLFLSLSGDFATRVARPPAVAEEDDTGDLRLFEANFINPIPSLFTLATLSTVDVSVEPIASMVAEYVATSGRYGIVPPTAPPPQAPAYQMVMPAIFATIQSPAEKDSDFEVDFDPYDPTLQQWSAHIAAVMKNAQGQLDIMGSPEMWNNPQTLMTFEPLDVA